MADAKTLIQDYLDHIGDVAYIRAVFDQMGSEAVASALEEMIRGGDRAGMRDAWLFVEDAILQKAAPKDFRQAYPRSRLLAAIREQLDAPDFQVRHLAIGLLGKLGPGSNARFLADALPWYLAHDPLNLEGLLDELLWLSQRARRVSMRKRLVERMVSAPLFVTRWAAVETLWDREIVDCGLRWRQHREDAWVRQFLRRLAQDEHPRVRTEAAWRLGQIQAIGGQAARRRTRRVRREERRPAPDVPSFFEVSLNVRNYLGVSGEADYDAALVEAIAQYLVEYPITPGYDPYAYWSAFAASRGARVEV